MADGKKIVFEGVDNGVFTMMDKLKRKSDEMYKGIADDAAIVEKSEDKRLKFITNRIQEIEKENKLLSQQKKLLLDLEFKKNESAFTSNKSATGADYNRFKEIESKYKQDIESLNIETLERKAQTGFLRENLNERTNELLSELIDTVRQSHEEELFVEGQRMVGNTTTGGVTTISTSDTSSTKEGIVTQSKDGQLEKRGVFKDVLAANLITELVRGIVNKVSGLASGAANAQSGETFAADLISSIPFGGIIGHPMRRHIDEQFNFQVSQNRLRGLTGTRYGIGMSNPSLGFSANETLPIMEDIARQAGTSNGLDERTDDLMNIERGLSFDRSTVMRLFKDSRSTTDSSALSDVAKIIYNTKGAPGEENLELMQEFVQLQSEIVDQNKTIIEKQDKGVIADMLGRFTSVDSKMFKNPEVLKGIMGSFDQTLKNPSNDFAQARNFSILSQIKPGASYFEMLEMQSKGLQQEDFLHQTMGFLEKTTGGGENMMTSLVKNFGLTPEAARKFTEAYQKNPEIFKGMGGSVESIAQQANIELLIKDNAKKNVAGREIEQASITDAFIESEGKGMAKVIELTGLNMANIIAESIKPIVSEVAKLVEKIIPKGTEGTQMPVGGSGSILHQLATEYVLMPRTK